jgi:multiple sugar transport system permease protein
MALLLAGCFFLLPVAGVVVLSFLAAGQMRPRPTLAHYATLLWGGMPPHPGLLAIALPNALLLAAGAAGLALALGIPSAYAVARWRLRGGEALAVTLLACGLAPPLLQAMPLSLILHRIGAAGSPAAVIWSDQIVCLPAVLWILRWVFADIAPEIEQASRADGHAWWHAAARVALPLAGPGIAAAGLLAFLLAWSNPLLPPAQPVTLAALALVAAPQPHAGVAAAAIVLSLLPNLALVLYLRRKLPAAPRLRPAMR